MDGAGVLALRDRRLAPSGVPIIPLVVAPSSDDTRENSVSFHSGGPGGRSGREGVKGDRNVKRARIP